MPTDLDDYTLDSYIPRLTYKTSILTTLNYYPKPDIDSTSSLFTLPEVQSPKSELVDSPTVVVYNSSCDLLLVQNFHLLVLT